MTFNKIDYDKLTFGVYPVQLRKIGDDIYIHCKNTIGTYSQIQHYLRKGFTTDGRYPYGVRTSDKCYIERSRTINTNTKIACLEATKEETDMLIAACESLL